MLAVLYTATTAQYGPDPTGVPADFQCAWRKLTLDYATELRPDAAALVHDALTLTASCNDTVPRPTPTTRDFPPTTRDYKGSGFTVYVDGTRGSDTAAGTLIAPLKTLSAAVTKTRAGGPALDEIIVRAGTYRFTRDSGPLVLDERDSHLTIRNYPNETVWMSGATLLAPPKWTPFQNTLTKMSAPLSDIDNARGCALDDPRNATCGCVTAVDAPSCAQMCLADERCTSYTMHTETSDKWAKKCCLRRDATWTPWNGGKGHVSGQKIVGTNVWQADVSDAENIDWSYGIPELRVDGARATQARYPNANPETQFWPTGYLTSDTGFVPDGDWLNPTIAPKPNTAIPVQVAGRGKWESQFEAYSGGINGTCSIYTPPFSFWCSSNFSDGCGGCFTWNIPSGLKFNGTKLPNAKSYTNVQDAQLFAWRKAHWANWMFDIESITMDSHDDASMGTDSSSGGTIKVGSGGFQGARGGAGSDWFISNILEELDSPGEFYLDKHTKTLYFSSNATDGKSAPSASLVIEAVQQHTLMSVIGKSMNEPVTNLSIVGIGFRDTAPTFMEPHGVPSGGDWALERFGALFVERSSSLTVSGCKWTRASGNGVSLNRFNLNATIEDSTFEWMGGSAIAAWGFTDEISDGGIHGIDGTDGDFPRYTLVQRNLFREIGQWEKVCLCLCACVRASKRACERGSTVLYALRRKSSHVTSPSVLPSFLPSSSHSNHPRFFKPRPRSRRCVGTWSSISPGLGSISTTASGVATSLRQTSSSTPAARAATTARLTAGTDSRF